MENKTRGRFWIRAKSSPKRVYRIMSRGDGQLRDAGQSKHWFRNRFEF